MKDHTKKLIALGACRSAVEESDKYESLQDFWDNCDFPFWLEWYLICADFVKFCEVTQKLAELYGIENHGLEKSIVIKCLEVLRARPGCTNANIILSNDYRKLCPII